MASKPDRNRASAAGRGVPAFQNPALQKPALVSSRAAPPEPACSDPIPDPVVDAPMPPVRAVPACDDLPAAARRSPPGGRPQSPPDLPPDPPEPALDAHGYDPDEYDWVPVRRAQRVDGWGPERQRSFIGHLADTGSVRTAATLSGMSSSGAYRLRRAPEGKAFAAAWDAAIQQAASALIDAAFERAVHGSEEPVFDRNGHVVGRRFRQSDAMMMFLLRKHFPDRYGDLHRDRALPAIAAPAPPPPPVDDALARLGPVPPADPAATLDPDTRDLRLARADAGHLPADLREEDAQTGLGPEFEEMLVVAKRGPVPDDDGYWDRLDRRYVYYDVDDDEDEYDDDDDEDDDNDDDDDEGDDDGAGDEDGGEEGDGDDDLNAGDRDGDQPSSPTVTPDGNPHTV